MGTVPVLEAETVGSPARLSAPFPRHHPMRPDGCLRVIYTSGEGLSWPP
jgi:hypothetical protein